MLSMITFTLNGKKTEYSGDGKTALLKWLRGSKKIKSVKDGCSNEGTCGACLVEIDSKPRLSCSVLMEKLDGTNIVTLEGIPDEVRSTLGRAFVASGAVQCGFCSPGMLMRTNILFRKNPDPSREEVVKAIKPHLCRCTGYVKIIDAVLLASKKIKNKEEIRFETDNVGKSAPKYKALDRATGAPSFIDDMDLENMAYGALFFSEHPRAKVLKIDTSKAEAMEGVLKVLTACDIPGQRRLGMVIEDWPVYVAEGETTSFIGDVLASVIAKSETIAREGVKAIKVEYEVYEPLTDPESALRSDIKLHENGNVLKEFKFCYGNDVEDVFASSAYVVSDTYRTQLIEHAFLETESCFSLFEDNKLTVYSQSQDIYKEREQIAKLLSIEKEEINIKLVPPGGGFGGKLDLTVQSHSALAAYYLKQPVKVKLNRFESIRMHPKKHPMQMTYKLACDEEGKFTGLYARILGDTGGYASIGIGVVLKAAAHAGGAYFVPNVDVKSTAVYTNNLVAGAMRGFGSHQVVFAMERIIDKLCEKTGFDRWDIRYKNVLYQKSMTTAGDIIRADTGLKKALDILKKRYQNSRYAGIACAIKNCGLGFGVPEQSHITLEVAENGNVRILHGWTEMGQGIDTILRQMLYEHLSPYGLHEVEIVVATEHETQGGPTSASSGTFLAGNSLLEAVRQLKKDIGLHGGLSRLAGKRYKGKYVYNKTTPVISNGEGKFHFAYSYAAQVVELSDHGKIKKITAVHNSGKMINKNFFEGQIEGGIVMGLGYAAKENLRLDKGKIVNGTLGKLGLLRSTDIPEIEIIPLELEEAEGPFGAKGVGEIAIIPTAPAVASAYTAFDGQKRKNLPLKPVENKGGSFD
jgi:aldehyde oxidoreductase